MDDFVILGKLQCMEELEFLSKESLTEAQKEIYKMFAIRLSEDEWKEIADLINGYIISKRVDPEILAKNPTRLNEQQLQVLNVFKSPCQQMIINRLNRR